MNRTYLYLITFLNIFLLTIVVTTFDHLTSIYAQKLDTNDTQFLVSNPSNSSKPNATETSDANNLFPFFQNYKVNTTDTPSIKVNATDTASTTKPNATTPASTSKPNSTETAASTNPKVSESPYAATIAKFQPGNKVNYCYSFNSKFGSLG